MTDRLRRHPDEQRPAEHHHARQRREHQDQRRTTPDRHRLVTRRPDQLSHAPSPAPAPGEDPRHLVDGQPAATGPAPSPPAVRTRRRRPAPRERARRSRRRRQPAPPPDRRARPRTRRHGWRATTALPCSASTGAKIRGQPTLRGVVQPPGRFVEQHDRRVGRQLHGERERQSLSFGEVAWVSPRVDVVAAGQPPEHRPGGPVGGTRGSRRQRAHSASRSTWKSRSAACCGTSATSPAASRRLTSREDRPSTSTRPDAIGPDPWSAQSNEDLPDPLRPMSATTSPGATARSTSRTTSRCPYRTTTPRASSPRTRPPPSAARRGIAGRLRQTRPGHVADLRPQWRGEPTRLSHRERSGSQPASRPSSTTGGASSGLPHHGRGRAAPDAVLVHDESTIGVLHDPLEPVLRRETVMPRSWTSRQHGGQHVLGGSRVERRRRLVEDEHARRCGERGTDGDALLLTAGQGAERAPAQRCDPQQVEHLLHASPHHGRRGVASCSMTERQLLFDRVGDEARQRILPDHPDRSGELPGRTVPRVVPGT